MSGYSGVESGQYHMVHCDENEAIWFDPRTRSTVRESFQHDNAPFKHILTDFDGFLVDTESPGHFFDEIWARTFQEAGLDGSVEQLSNLRWKVYEWRSDVVTSTQAMVTRIRTARDKNDQLLTSGDAYQLSLLLKQTTIDKFQVALGEGYSHIHDPAILLAERKEQLGVQLLKSTPKRVLELAPLMPGVLEFLDSVPSEVILTIVSAGRRATILEPIMNAYSKLIPNFAARFTGMLFGEEDGGGHTKPSEEFIEKVRWNCAHRLHATGRIPHGGVSIHDTLMMGDKPLDTPAKRGGMHHITVGKNPGHLGPLTSHSTDLYDLLASTRDKEAIKNDFTLRKLSHTLK